LAPVACQLKRAGLDRVNISLDTVDPASFTYITRVGTLDSVVQGIDAAIQAGLVPVKLNAVLSAGVNDDLESVSELLRFAGEHRATLRFIELMPVGQENLEMSDRFVPAGPIIEGLKKAGKLGKRLSPAGPGGGPAVYYELPGGGEVGFITALSENFCATCSRLRLTADGRLYPCLASADYVEVREPLRSGATDRELADLIRVAVRNKPEKHHFLTLREARKKQMSKMGG